LATIAALIPSAEQRERLFFLVMTTLLAVLTVGGFALNAALGRANPSPPAVYHMHALAYVGWLALNVAQGVLIYRNDLRWHRVLGIAAMAWLPVLVVLALAMTIASIRLNGGPPVLSVNDFLFVNTMHIVGFAALTGVAVAMWRQTDWHRRLMLCGLASIGAPGIARLLPLPLFVPYAFPALFIAAMAFPAIALAVDARRTGRVHPAWLWGIAAVFASLFIGQALAATAWGQGVTRDLIAGTPGAERPFEAFVPG